MTARAAVRARAQVTDHAVVRYLERVWGVDIDALRARIAREAESGVQHGAAAVNRGKVKFVLQGALVVTVKPRPSVCFKGRG